MSPDQEKIFETLTQPWSGYYDPATRAELASCHPLARQVAVHNVLNVTSGSVHDERSSYAARRLLAEEFCLEPGELVTAILVARYDVEDGIIDE
jgi:hypothetical protein